MAQVYLPMGYPIQSGNEFANVIYQGNVVRLYTLAKDPRSDAQLQNRRFLSDVVKVRSNLGVWGKGACRSALGTKWGTVLYQIIKADIESWWSDALTEWATFTDAHQDEWRAASPYQATFNDVGEIYFGLTRVIYHALLFYSGITWFAEEWAETDSAGAAAWWVKDNSSAMVKGQYNDDNALISYVGSWTNQSDGGSLGGQYRKAGPGGIAYLEFFYYGRIFQFGFFLGPTFGAVAIALDGGNASNYTEYYATEIRQYASPVDGGRRGLHHVRVTLFSGLVNVDFIKVL